MKIEVPELSVVVLVGVQGAGKSVFAQRWFQPEEIVSKDTCAEFRQCVAQRLQQGLLAVVDDTNLYPQTRKQYVDMARSHHAAAVAIVLATPVELCLQRNADRGTSAPREDAVRFQAEMLAKTLRTLGSEGFQQVYVLNSPDEVEFAEVMRVPLPPTRFRSDRGPFDIIGDVHGCYEELMELLQMLGWRTEGALPMHPEGRKLVFLGDFGDRGPNSVGVFRLAMQMVEAGTAYAVIGNHDYKLLRYLQGEGVHIPLGLRRTLDELEHQPPAFHDALREFIQGLPSHLVLDEGRLVVAHAGIKQSYIGRESPAVREFCIYGETTGERDEYGLPVRLNWAERYQGEAFIVYGHTPYAEPMWQNNTVNIDTGCVFGGRLTALRYPERELVSVPAREVYYLSKRPLAGE